MAKSGMRFNVPLKSRFEADVRPGAGFFYGQMMASARALLTRIGASAEESAITIALMVEELFDRIVASTPVDRSPEADNIVAQKSWHKEADTSPDETVWRIWNDAKNPYNDFPYPVALEYGYSDQAPEGMVRFNIEKFRDELRDEVKKLVSRAKR